MPSRPRHQPSRPPQGAEPSWHMPLLLALLVAATGADLFRLGFFGDDFHLLDVARRMPVGEVLLGRHGIWPWYRPLSRELYFYLLAAAGPAGQVVARALSLTCLLGTAWMLHRLGRILLGPRPAIGAIALFVTYSYTKFVTGWASGFQDVLATLLVIWALCEHVRGRTARALLVAALAPFAKESGFLAVPLILLHALLCEGRRRPDRRMAGYAAVWAGTLAIQLLVRAGWPPGPPHVSVPSSALDMVQALASIFTGFLSPGVPPGATGFVLGLLAAASVALLARTPRTRLRGGPLAGAGAPVRPYGAAAFLAIAAVLGTAPLAILWLTKSNAPNARFAYAAAPWLALLGGLALAGLPARVWRVALAALVCLNVWGLGYRAPDLESERGWRTGLLGWDEAVRIAGKTDRLSRDLRVALASRPESVVVVYSGLPNGSWFQTEDGPATREILRDPTALAYFINQVPRRIPADRFVMITFDRLGTRHLARVPRTVGAALTRSVLSLMGNRPEAARAWARYCPDRGVGRFYAPYLEAATVLEERGVPDFVARLRAMGLGDTLDARPAAARTLIGTPDSVLCGVYALVLRRPCSAAAHLACADSLEARGRGQLACVELRIALDLRPGTSTEYARLGRLLAQLGFPGLAREPLERAVAIGAPADAADQARRAIAGLGAASDTDPGR
jgi:hypothetical protein